MSAEVLFLRKQLAFYREHQVRPRKLTGAGQYARTVRGETKIPNFTDSSAAMRSSPQVGFSRTMRTISWRRTSGIRGLPNRDFHRQNSLNPLRCQPMRARFSLVLWSQLFQAIRDVSVQILERKDCSPLFGLAPTHVPQ